MDFAPHFEGGLSSFYSQGCSHSPDIVILLNIKFIESYLDNVIHRRKESVQKAVDIVFVAAERKERKAKSE